MTLATAESFEGLNPEAVEFVRFCHGRRRTGWPELYDEMCSVAARGLFHGWRHAELAEHGIGFSLTEMPALATLVRRVVGADRDAARADAAAEKARSA